MIESIKFWIAREVAGVLFFLAVFVALLVVMGIIEWRESRARKHNRGPNA